MASARAIEYRITQELLERRGATVDDDNSALVQRLICTTALAGGMLLFGSVVPELLGVFLAAGALTALGAKTSI